MVRPVLLLLAAASSLVASAQTYGKGFTGKKVLSAYFPSYQMSPAVSCDPLLGRPGGRELTSSSSSSSLSRSQDVPYKKYTHLDYFVFTTTPSVSPEPLIRSARALCATQRAREADEGPFAGVDHLASRHRRLAHPRLCVPGSRSGRHRLVHGRRLDWLAVRPSTLSLSPPHRRRR